MRVSWRSWYAPPPGAPARSAQELGGRLTQPLRSYALLSRCHSGDLLVSRALFRSGAASVSCWHLSGTLSVEGHPVGLPGLVCRRSRFGHPPCTEGLSSQVGKALSGGLFGWSGWPVGPAMYALVTTRD